MRRRFTIIALSFLAAGLPARAADGPVCAASEEGQRPYSELQPTVPGSWRPALKSQPSPLRSGEEPMGPKLQTPRSDETAGRWLRGYRPVTREAWETLEAWKARAARGGAESARVPSAANSRYGVNLLSGTRAPQPPVESIEHIVRETKVEVSTVDLRELDLGARAEGGPAKKAGGPKGEIHHGSGLTWNDYLTLKQLAESSPATPDAQQTPGQAARAPVDAGVAFDAILSDFTSVPPDPIMTAGPSHLVAIVNRRYQVFDKTGAALTADIDLDTFFSGMANCDGVFDVYVDYDEANDRFVMGGMNVMDVAGTTTYLCLAASATGDPAGAWHRAGFRADANAPSEWVDFPHMGIGLDEIYISGNMFSDSSNSFDHTRIFAVERDALYAGNPIAVAEASLGTIFFTAQPAKIRGFTSGGWPAPGTPHHFISHDGGGNTRIWRWTDPFNQAPVVYGDVVEAAFNGVPPQAPELGGGFPQDTGSGKWLDAEYRDGRLYATRNVACDFGGGSSESCIDWIQIDVSGPAPLLEQQQTGGAYGSADEYRYYPDLAIDRNNGIAIGYTRSGNAEYPGVWITGREFGDAPGTLQAETLQRAGLGNYSDGAGCLGSCDRWGDYTGMAMDPDGCTFWYLGQYSDGGNYNWGTHIGSFRFPSCSVDSTLQVSKGSVTCNDSLTITVTDSTPLNAATISAQTAFTTTGGDSETVPPGGWIGSNCGGPDCTTWTTTLAVSGFSGAPSDGTLNVADGETVTATYVDPHAGHDDQSRNVAATCSTRLDDGGYLTSGGCEGAAGPEFYREYIDGGEYVSYTFGIFNPLTAPALTDVEATLSVAGPAAGKVTVFNPTVHVGALQPGQLSGPVFHLYVDPSIDAAGLRLSSNDFNLSLTSVADGFTEPQVLTQVQLLQGDDHIVRESECWNFESGTEGFVNDRYVHSYTCQFSDGCPTTTFVSTVESPWTRGDGCGSETRTDHPDMSCDTGGANAFMSNADPAVCGDFAQAGDQLADDILYSPVFGPANSGNAANGQPWFFDWQYAEWFYRSDMVSGADPAMEVGFFWDDDYQGTATPAANEIDTLYSFFLGYFTYGNTGWDSDNGWDPADPPLNFDGTGFGGGPRLADAGLQWRWAVEVYDADWGGWPQETPATAGLAVDNMQFVYDQYHAEEQFGTCGAPAAVAAFDRYAYLECPGDNVGIGVLAPAAAGSVRVTVRSLGSGDSETLLIVGPGPYYAASLPYSTGAGPSVDDGTLLVVPSDLLTLTYLDDPSAATAFAFLECEGGDVVSEGVAAMSDNGDGDDFADRNETVDLSLRIRNNTTQDLVNAVVTIATDDPNVDCVTKASASFGTVPANGGTATNDLVADPFTFKVADQAECADPTAPPTATFRVFVAADGFNGTSAPQQFTLILDLNDLPGTITFWENFTTDPVGFHHETGPGDDDRVAVDVGGLTCSPYVDDFFWSASGGNTGGAYFLWQDPADTFPNGTYSDLNDAALYSPVLKVGATSTTLTFDHEYLFAWTSTFRLDGVRVDYQVNGGAWQKLQTLPYDGALIWNAYCNPLCNGNEFYYPCFTENAEAGELVFNQLDQGVVDWTNVAGQISGLNPGDLVRLRWRFGSMNSSVYGIGTQGGYGLDNVRLTNVVELECDAAVNPDTGCGVVFDSAGNLVEVCGDGDILIEPTETWSVDVTLRNSGASDAVGTTAALSTGLATPLAASIPAPNAAFGTIPGAGATATASYEFGVDAGALCIDDIVFDVLNIADSGTSYADQPSAFSVAVGGPGAQELAAQVVDPVIASGGSTVTDLTPGFAIPAPVTSASLTFGHTYTNVTPEQTATQDTDPLIAENASVTTTLSAALTIDPADAVSVTLDWTSLTHEKVFECTRVYVRTPQGFSLTLKDFDEAVANPYDLLAIYQNPNGGPGQYEIGLQEEASGPCKMDAQLSGATLTVAESSTTGTWTGNVEVSLWDGGGYTVIKPFGAADAQPYDVTAVYNAAGPGAYKLRLREVGGGGTADLDGAVLAVTGIECDAGCATFVAPPPPVGDDVVGDGLRLAKGATPDEILLTFDSATCSADHAVVLYGDLGNYAGYAGAVDGGCDAGAGPTATVTHAGDNVWFIVHWVNQNGAAGSAGDASAGPRGWPAAGLCGVVTDDTSDGVCD